MRAGATGCVGESAQRGWTRRRALCWVGAGAGLLALGGCGASVRRQPAPGGSSSGPASAASGTAGAAARADYLYLAVLTGGMIGRKGWPLFVPGDLSVPAGALVQAEIRCFDNGAAPVPAGYLAVRGTTDGRITVIPRVDGSLAGAAATPVTSLAAGGVAHTFTVAGLGLNVPIPPESTVRFSFRTGAAGTHGWRCMAACGTGDSGMEGPMATGGWMEGTMTVLA